MPLNHARTHSPCASTLRLGNVSEISTYGLPASWSRMPGVLTPHLLANNSRYAQTTNLHELTPTRYGGCPHSFNSTCPAKSHESFIWKWGWKSFFADLIGKIHYWNKTILKGYTRKIRLHCSMFAAISSRRFCNYCRWRIFWPVFFWEGRDKVFKPQVIMLCCHCSWSMTTQLRKRRSSVFVSQEGLWFEQLSVVNFKFGEAKRGQSHLTVTINEEV